VSHARTIDLRLHGRARHGVWGQQHRDYSNFRHHSNSDSAHRPGCPAGHIFRPRRWLPNRRATAFSERIYVAGKHSYW